MIVTLTGTLLALRTLRREVVGADRAGDVRGVRLMVRERNRWLTGYALIVYAFLFAPIVVLIIYSFNRARRGLVWQGFTFDWYPGSSPTTNYWTR